MTPTPYALAIRAEVVALVRQAELLLQPQNKLDLLSLERSFSVRGHDAAIVSLAPQLVTVVAASAPKVTLRFLAEPASETPELARGQIDLELGGTEPTSPEISHETLVSDRLVLASRANHPLEREALTLQRFAQAEHLTVSRRGRLADGVDDALAEHGLRRRVVASLPTASAALEVAAFTDYVVIVPEVACQRLCDALQLRTHSLPLPLRPTSLVMAWHQRHDRDPAHSWLRDQVRNVTRSIKSKHADARDSLV